MANTKWEIILQGKDLLEGVNADQYTVYVENEHCADVQVTMTSISSTPPKSVPDGNIPQRVKVNIFFHTVCSKDFVSLKL